MSAAEGKVTLKIPRPLYLRLSCLVEESGFNSVTDFIVYVLRYLASSRGDRPPDPTFKEKGLSPEEITAIRKRLKLLGYF